MKRLIKKAEDNMNKSIIEIYQMILNNELNMFPFYCWRASEGYYNAAECTKYMIENILFWNDDDIKNLLSMKIFRDNKLGGMLNELFNNSPYDALNNAYPEKFKPWELKVSGWKYWNQDTGIESIKWLIENKLQWTDDDIKKYYNRNIIKENGLGGMLNQVFNNSPWAALNATYPERFKPWETKVCPQGYWNENTAIEATKWLIEDKLGLTIKDLQDKHNMPKRAAFSENGLRGMLNIIYNDVISKALKAAYPDLENY